MSFQNATKDLFISKQFAALNLIGGKDVDINTNTNGSILKQGDLRVRGGAFIEKNLRVGGSILSEGNLIADTISNALLTTDLVRLNTLQAQDFADGINVIGSLIPSDDSTFNLGSNVSKWSSVFCDDIVACGNLTVQGDTSLETVNGNVTFTGNVVFQGQVVDSNGNIIGGGGGSGGGGGPATQNLNMNNFQILNAANVCSDSLAVSNIFGKSSIITVNTTTDFKQLIRAHDSIDLSNTTIFDAARIEFNQGRVEIGSGTVSASGSSTVAIGEDAVAQGTRSVSIGFQADAGADESVSIGPDSSTTSIGVVIGRNAVSTVTGGVAIGPDSRAAGTVADVAIGSGAGSATSFGDNVSVGRGAGSGISGASNTVLGSNAGQTIASGSQNVTVGDSASTAGTAVNIVSVGHLAIGRLGGTSIGKFARQNAGNYGSTFGSFADSNGDSSTIIGARSYSSAAADFGVAVGFRANVFATDDVQLGRNLGASVGTGVLYFHDQQVSREDWIGGGETIACIDDNGYIERGIYTFPSMDGNPGDSLVTDGSGTLSFANVSGGVLDDTPCTILEFIGAQGNNGDVVKVVPNNGSIAGVELLNQGNVELASLVGTSQPNNLTDPEDISVDQSTGNYFISPIQAGPIQLGDLPTLSSNAYPSVFFAKVNSEGEYLDYVSTGLLSGTGDSGRIAVAESGNVQVGFSHSNGNVDPGGLGPFGPVTDFTVILAQLNNNLEYQWAETANQPSGTAFVRGITINPVNGTTYIAGNFSGQIGFGALPLVTNTGSQNIFVVAVDASGNFLWLVKAGGTTGAETVNDIEFSGTNDLYITGTFNTESTFGAAGTLTGGAGQNLFLAKMNAATGDFVWAIEADNNGISAVSGQGVDVDSTGNVYVSGFFGGTPTFTGLPDPTADGTFDIFLSKANTSGNWLSVKHFGSAGDQCIGDQCRVDSADNVFVTGTIDGTVNCDGLTATSSFSNPNAFIAQFDPNGTCKLLEISTTSSAGQSDSTNGIDIDNNDGSVYTIARMTNAGTISYGNLPQITNPGGNGYYVLKLENTADLSGYIGLLKTGTVVSNGDQVNVCFSAGAIINDAFDFALVPGTEYFISETGVLTDEFSSGFKPFGIAATPSQMITVGGQADGQSVQVNNLDMNEYDIDNVGNICAANLKVGSVVSTETVTGNITAQGIPLIFGNASTGDLLTYNGSSWIPAAPSISLALQVFKTSMSSAGLIDWDGSHVDTSPTSISSGMFTSVNGINYICAVEGVYKMEITAKFLGGPGGAVREITILGVNGSPGNDASPFEAVDFSDQRPWTGTLVSVIRGTIGMDLRSRVSFLTADTGSGVGQCVDLQWTITRIGNLN